ncbi:MAG TPA: Gfo/Idh/MocA family oxidoreductase, partial [Patescibacteria group bacterium]|nr:Gfo/Idh/MocA family oxidoreductase [Patescibacteria group bacterium]
AEGVIIASPDREHAGPAIAALERNHHVLLEKPIAPTAAEVRAVADAAATSRGSVTVAHVLRYTPFFSAVKRALDDGVIGDLVTITHAERIGYWHFAHSFVRGNWRREDQSSPMLLAKACHDLDLLRWLAGDRCTAVASFGGLRHFRPEAAPPGALQRCWDGERRCPAAPDCPFDAIRLYVERTADVTGWPVSVITDEAAPEGRLEALASGPYGRCVYASDNDVADHQVVALEFANGVRATLIVSGLTPDNTRTIIIGGTRGELSGRLDTGRIEIRRFLPGGRAYSDGPWDRDEQGRQAMRDDERTVIDTSAVAVDGHGGGDGAMLDDVVARLTRLRDAGDGPVAAAPTELADAIDSHLMAFAAEESRHERRLVELADR